MSDLPKIPPPLKSMTPPSTKDAINFINNNKPIDNKDDINISMDDIVTIISALQIVFQKEKEKEKDDKIFTKEQADKIFPSWDRLFTTCQKVARKNNFKQLYSD